MKESFPFDPPWFFSNIDNTLLKVKFNVMLHTITLSSVIRRHHQIVNPTPQFPVLHSFNFSERSSIYRCDSLLWTPLVNRKAAKILFPRLAFMVRHEDQKCKILIRFGENPCSYNLTTTHPENTYCSVTVCPLTTSLSAYVHTNLCFIYQTKLIVSG